MYVPQRVVTNQELEALVHTTDAWILARTGIRERHIAADHETASSMAIAASREALERASLAPEALDLVIAATVTPERLFPATASVVQHALGANRAAAFDLNAACSGFVYALATAWQFIASGAYQNVLVVGSEVYSRILDWEDRATCVLFGDGAGAVLLQAQERPGLLSFVLGSDGGGADLLYVPGLGASPVERARQDGRYHLQMNGREVFRFAVSIMADVSRQAVAEAGLEMEHVELLIPHQANRRIILAAAKALGLAPERVLINVDRYGNTSAASIPIALCEAVQSGCLKRGDHAVLVGFGGGLSWGALALEWS